VGTFSFASAKHSTYVCRAYMFVLHVAEELDVWPERERERCWVGGGAQLQAGQAGVAWHVGGRAAWAPSLPLPVSCTHAAPPFAPLPCRCRSLTPATCAGTPGCGTRSTRGCGATAGTRWSPTSSRAAPAAPAQAAAAAAARSCCREIRLTPLPAPPAHDRLSGCGLAAAAAAGGFSGRRPGAAWAAPPARLARRAPCSARRPLAPATATRGRRCPAHPLVPPNRRPGPPLSSHHHPARLCSLLGCGRNCLGGRGVCRGSLCP